MLDLVIVLVLVLLNGLFSLSELAVVSARRPRLQAIAGAFHADAGTAEPGAVQREDRW